MPIILPDSSTVNWGEIYNQAITAINQIATANSISISDIINQVADKANIIHHHQASQIMMQDNETNIEDAINFHQHQSDQIILPDGTDVGHAIESKITKPTGIIPATKGIVTFDANGLIRSGRDIFISDLPDIPMSKITGLQPIIDVLNYNISDCEIESSIQNRSYGVDASFCLSTHLAPDTWVITVLKNNSVISKQYGNHITIDKNNLNDGDTIVFSVKAYKNGAYITQAYTHTYSVLSAEITETQIVESLVNDSSFVQMIANQLQHSIVLARKTAELSHELK